MGQVLSTWETKMVSYISISVLLSYIVLELG
jgi:hypothetical protein